MDQLQFRDDDVGTLPPPMKFCVWSRVVVVILFFEEWRGGDNTPYSGSNCHYIAEDNCIA